jgi:uncharacterized protein YuzE
MKSQNTQKKPKGSEVNYTYDEDADVLYAHIGEPKPAKSIEYDNGIVLRLRFDINTKKYIGFTIIGYMNRKKRGLIKRIPHFKIKQIQLPDYSNEAV